jgi:hypothetical protein
MKKSYAVAAAVLLLTSVPIGLAMASASNSSGVLFVSNSMVGSTPGMTVRGVAAGGAPWVVSSAVVQLDRDGRLHANIHGLLISKPGSPLDGTVGPVTGVRASLTCEGTNVVASTGLVSLDANGNTKIDQMVTLPQSCVGPIILIQIGSTTSNPGPTLGPWIAATGF